MRKLAATVSLMAAAALMGAYLAASKTEPSDDVSLKEGALAAQTCTGLVSERVDCGWPGISDGQCWDMGCCFDASNPNVPNCYYPFMDDEPDRGTGPGRID